MARFSYELPEDITEIADILDELIEKRPLSRIRLKTRGEFQNVYVDKIMQASSSDEDDDASDADTGSDEDVEDTDGGVPDAPEESDDEESDDEESDDEGGDDGDDEQEVEVGMRVIASTKKGDAAGEIVEIIEDEGKVRVSLDEGRTVRISVDKLEAEPVTTPPKKARKRPQ